MTDTIESNRSCSKHLGGGWRRSEGITRISYAIKKKIHRPCFSLSSSPTLDVAPPPLHRPRNPQHPLQPHLRAGRSLRTSKRCSSGLLCTKQKCATRAWPGASSRTKPLSPAERRGQHLAAAVRQLVLRSRSERERLRNRVVSSQFPTAHLGDLRTAENNCKRREHHSGRREYVEVVRRASTGVGDHDGAS